MDDAYDFSVLFVMVPLMCILFEAANTACPGWDLTAFLLLHAFANSNFFVEDVCSHRIKECGRNTPCQDG